ncbi:MAG: adenylosuccinate lyase [Cyanobacteria bacterium RYN_339]|nr:adenylosuccinate lyase [Cyanobacteria bacterium RYN_339]
MRLNALSPLDGRYADQVAPLARHFSELALIRGRVEVEVAYLRALAAELGRPIEIPPIDFTEADGEAVKAFERTTRHDVKAVEYWLKEKLPLGADLELIHLGLTSEDVNNLAYAGMHRAALREVLLPALSRLLGTLAELARRYHQVPMLGRTHGQPASPTTMGKELGVFAARLAREVTELVRHELPGKLGGATGTLAALQTAFPDHDWRAFSRGFVQALGCKPSPVTTQIEPGDGYAAVYDCLRRINNILLDLSLDMWRYISDGYFRQAVVAGEVGSSAMPHKVNPIDFENAEGNLGLANALLVHLGGKLTVSRLQRDLSGSTVMRNSGVALAHGFLAWLSVERGLARVVLDEGRLAEDLSNHPEVLAEAIQTVLRADRGDVPYEKLKELTQGRKVTLDELRLRAMELAFHRADIWNELSPASYVGLAPELAIEAAQLAEAAMQEIASCLKS